PATPLGFQDLTEDERLIVAVYRDWRAGGPTSAVVEHAIARHLRCDRLYGALEPLFALFRQLSGVEASGMPFAEDVLLPSEERLLDILSSEPPAHAASDEAAACRDALRTAGISPRNSDRIERSGVDATLFRIKESYLVAARLR
ncbi:MAG: hypothetical protein AAF844_18385, partial [Pseudomonadota bacterium]